MLDRQQLRGDALAAALRAGGIDAEVGTSGRRAALAVVTADCLELLDNLSDGDRLPVVLLGAPGAPAAGRHADRPGRCDVVRHRAAQRDGRAGRQGPARCRRPQHPAAHGAHRPARPSAGSRPASWPCCTSSRVGCATTRSVWHSASRSTPCAPTCRTSSASSRSPTGTRPCRARDRAARSTPGDRVTRALVVSADDWLRTALQAVLAGPGGIADTVDGEARASAAATVDRRLRPGGLRLGARRRAGRHAGARPPSSAPPPRSWSWVTAPMPSC